MRANITFNKYDTRISNHLYLKITVPCPMNFSLRRNNQITEGRMALLHFFLKQFPHEPNSTLYLTTILCFVGIVFVIMLTRRRNKSSINLPPSPPKLPIIGNLHQLGTLPHRSFHALANKYGPLMLLHLGQTPTLVVSSADVAKEIIKNHDVVFSSRPQSTAAKILLYECQDIGFAPYGEEWRQKRKVCVLEILSPKRVKSFQSIREEEVAELVGTILKASCEMKTGYSVNLSKKLIATINNVMARCVLGQKYDTASDGSSSFGEIGRKLMRQIAAFCVGDYFPSLGWIDNLAGLTGEFKATFAAIDAFFDEVIAQHKRIMVKKDDDDDQSDCKDFVEILLQLEEKGMLDFKLTGDILKAILMDMFVGASDTTSATLELVGTILKACEETGSSVNMSEKLIAISNNIVSSVTDYFPSLGWIDHLTGLISKFKATSAALDAFFDKVIEEHKRMRNNGGDEQSDDSKDFVDILLQLQESRMLDFELTGDIIKAIVTDMFVGGSDTTSTALEWTFAELIKNPNTMRKAQEEVRRVVGRKSKVDEDDVNQMNYLKCVVKESLRLHPPLPVLVPRATTSSVKVGGYDIPPKTRVFVNAWAIHRDPELWDNPEEFIPERFEINQVDFKGQDFQLVPFGSGRRGCPGISFGVTSTEYVLANLLYWFDWKLPGTGDIDMSEMCGLTVCKKVPLLLEPVPYSFIKA